MGREEFLMDQIENHAFKKDGTFRFHCNQCGKCCYNHDDILLSPYDLCRLSEGLKISIPEVMDKYCDVYIGKNSHLPVVALKMKSDGWCPLLKENKCSVHEFKPVICALFPLGRFLQIEKDDDRKLSTEDISYILMPEDCSDKGEFHTPAQWIKDFHLEESEDWFIVWQNILVNLSSAVSDILSLINIMPEDEQNMFYEVVVNFLYINYDTSGSITEQGLQNFEMISKMIQDIKNVLL